MARTKCFSRASQLMSFTRTTASWTWAERIARSSASSAIRRSRSSSGMAGPGSLIPDLVGRHLPKGKVARGEGSAAQPLDLGAAGGKLVLQLLEAAVEVIDAVHQRLAFRGEPGDHQGHRGPEVGRHDGCASQPLYAFHGGFLPIEVNIGAEPRQLLHVHETVFEYR